MRTGPPAEAVRIARPLCPHVIPVGWRDIGVVEHVQPDFPVCFVGKLGEERILEEQVLRRQGDAPGDQVIPQGNLADVETERVGNPAARFRGCGPDTRLADPLRQADGGIVPAMRQCPRVPDAERPPDRPRASAQHSHLHSVAVRGSSLYDRHPASSVTTARLACSGNAARRVCRMTTSLGSAIAGDDHEGEALGRGIQRCGWAGCCTSLGFLRRGRAGPAGK